MVVLAGLDKKKTLSQKIARVKRAGGMIQTEEQLPSKHEALSSNSSRTKKKTKKQKNSIDMLNTFM
jgi:hypothetical protein